MSAPWTVHDIQLVLAIGALGCAWIGNLVTAAHAIRSRSRVEGEMPTDSTIRRASWSPIGATPTLGYMIPPSRYQASMLRHLT